MTKIDLASMKNADLAILSQMISNERDRRIRAERPATAGPVEGDGQPGGLTYTEGRSGSFPIDRKPSLEDRVARLERKIEALKPIGTN